MQDENTKRLSIGTGLVVLRLDRDGNVTSGNGGAEELVSGAGTQVCHRLVGAKTVDGDPVCQPGCASELGAGAVPGHERLPVMIDGRPAQLTCQRVGDGAVVVVDPVRPIASPRNAAGEFLNSREVELLRYLARGDCLADLAMLLGVRESTVRARVHDLCYRLGARNQAQAVGIAVARGYLTSEDSPHPAGAGCGGAPGFGPCGGPAPSERERAGQVPERH